MIESILLLTGSSAVCVANYLLFFKIKKYEQVFDTTEKVMKMFNIGYLQTLSELPKDQYILLAGKAQHPSALERILQIKTNNSEHLKFINTGYQYSVFTKNNDELIVSNKGKTMVFNLKQFPDKQGKGIAHNTNIAMVGIQSHNVFTPLVLMGQNKDSFLKALDQKIVTLRSRSRNLAIFGTLLLVAHAVYKQSNRKQIS